MNPLISIIVPVYNVEKYLQKCVDSILEQSFKSIEVLLVDDGSLDNCGKICDAYARADERVRVIHQKNQGLSVARNTGIIHAKGEYICFVDSDDMVSPEYCNCLYKTAVQARVKMVVCKTERFSDDSFVKRENFKYSKEVIPFSNVLKRQMRGEIEMGVWNRVYHRSLFEKIRFKAGRIHEDIIFAGDLLLENCEDVVYVDVPLYYYRQRSDSIVNQQIKKDKCNPDRIFAARYLVSCARKVGFDYIDECLFYAVKYPWYFVDSIYVHLSFKDNMIFLNELQKLIRENINEYRKLSLLEDIQRKRMILFARSKILYGCNAYTRLFRLYLYKIIGKDAYKDGHGI